MKDTAIRPEKRVAEDHGESPTSDVTRTSRVADDSRDSPTRDVTGRSHSKELKRKHKRHHRSKDRDVTEQSTRHRSVSSGKRSYPEVQQLADGDIVAEQVSPVAADDSMSLDPDNLFDDCADPLQLSGRRVASQEDLVRSDYLQDSPKVESHSPNVEATTIMSTETVDDKTQQHDYVTAQHTIANSTVTESCEKSALDPIATSEGMFIGVVIKQPGVSDASSNADIGAVTVNDVDDTEPGGDSSTRAPYISNSDNQSIGISLVDDSASVSKSMNKNLETKPLDCQATNLSANDAVLPPTNKSQDMQTHVPHTDKEDTPRKVQTDSSNQPSDVATSSQTHDADSNQSTDIVAVGQVAILGKIPDTASTEVKIMDTMETSKSSGTGSEVAPSRKDDVVDMETSEACSPRVEKEPVAVTGEEDADGESWDALFDDAGDALDPSLMQEVNTVVYSLPTTILRVPHVLQCS